MPAPAVSYDHGPNRAANAAVEVRRALKAAVAENLSVEVYRSLKWSKSLSPTISDLRALRDEDGGGLGRMGVRARRELLKDNSMMTEMERGDGVLPSVARARGRVASIQRNFQASSERR